MCQTCLWVRQMASVIDTDPFSFMKNSLVSSCSFCSNINIHWSPLIQILGQWGIYSAFIITTFDNKERGICIRKLGENVIWQQLEIFLRLFTSSLLSQDLVNIEGIVPLKRICDSAKHSYIINPPAKKRSLMNLTSLEIKNRSLEFPVS